LRQKGFDASLPALIEDIRARDERDSTRAVAPLRPAEDALLIDSTSRSIDEVCELVMNQVRNLGLI
jgi:cytidylate kinase